jgi:hypothetical protein
MNSDFDISNTTPLNLAQLTLKGFECVDHPGTALNKPAPSAVSHAVNALLAYLTQLGWVIMNHFSPIQPLREIYEIEALFFIHQTRFNNFIEFKNWLKIGAGFCIWCPGLNGGIVPVAKAQNLNELDYEKAEQLARAMNNFVHSDHALKFMWPNMSASERLSKAIEIAKMNEY